MTKNTLKRPEVILLALFIVFWVIFAIVYGIRESNRIAGDFKGIQKSGILRVSGEGDLFSHYKNGTAESGFYYEILKAFAKHHHLELHYADEPDMTQKVRSLNEGLTDVISGPLPVISSLRSQLSFTNSIIESKLILVQRKESSFNKLAIMRNQLDFSNKKIYIMDNLAHMERLHHLAAEISDTIQIRKLIGFDSERLIAQVSAGLIDFAVCDKQVARAYLKRFPSIDIETPVGFNQMQAFGVRRNSNELLDSLNSFLITYKKSPAFTRLLNRYTAPISTNGKSSQN